MTRALTGWTLIGFALLMWLNNMSDAIADLHDWHGGEWFTPRFIAMAIKQAMTVVLSVLGGGLLPQLGRPDGTPPAGKP